MNRENPHSVVLSSVVRIAAEVTVERENSESENIPSLAESVEAKVEVENSKSKIIFLKPNKQFPPRIIKSNVKCHVDEHRKIFDAAEHGFVGLLLELHKGKFASEMPLDRDGRTPLIVLYQNLDRIRSKICKNDDKHFAMKAVMVDPFKALIDFYEQQSIDIDGIHPLMRGGEESALKCSERIYESWGKHDPRFSVIMVHLREACLKVATNSAKIATKKSSENTDSRCNCIFAFWNRKTVISKKIEPVTKMAEPLNHPT